jgi:hypothetical protein
MVKYKDIPGFPGYRVGDDGNVQSNKRVIGDGQWHTLSKGLSECGYEQIHLYRDGKSYARTVHRLVLEAFVGPRPPKHECRHLDGDKVNNRLVNLTWGTNAENVEDRKSSGQPWSPRRLDETKVREVRRLRSEGKTAREIAKEMGVGMWVISDVVRRRNWSWVE